MSLKIPRFIRHATLYSIGTALRGASSILLLPVYTRFLTPSDYGQVEIVVVFLSLIGTLINFDLTQPIFRYYNEADGSTAKRTVIHSGLALAGSINVVAAIIVVLAAPTLATHFLGGKVNSFLLVWAAPTLVLEALSALTFCHMRADTRAGLFMGISIVRLVTQILFNLLFLIVFHMGAAAIIYGNLISCAIQTFVALPYTLRGGAFRVSMNDLKKLVLLGGPLAMAGVATLVVSLGDRFFLSKLGSLAAVGVYALAYRFSQAVNTLIYQPFVQVWEPEQYRIHSRPNRHHAFPFVFRVVFTGLTLICLAIALFGPEFLRVLATQKFYDAAQPMPLLLLAVLFTAMTEFTRLGSVVGSKPTNVLFGAIIGAGVSVTGFLLLIPRFGAIGAASSMAVATLVRLAYEYTRARKSFDMRVDLQPVAVLLLACAGAVLLGRQLEPMTLVGVSVKFLMFAAIAAAAALLALRNFRRLPQHQELLQRLFSQAD